MAILSDIRPGAVIEGIENQEVTVTKSVSKGNQALQISYLNSQGKDRDKLLFKDELDELTLVSPGPLTTEDLEIFRLYLEATRIKTLSTFEPYQAAFESGIQPLPHQIHAVYSDMLPKVPLRYVLADDPGAGKTIMTGLLMKEYLARSVMENALIVAPGSLCQQWKEELKEKFDLDFDILDSKNPASDGDNNPFRAHPYMIAALDKLARNDDLLELLKKTEWDLIVCDEAHKMSATYFGNDLKETRRYKLGKLLGQISKNFLLLTATPHNGKNEDFELFMSLVDRDRFFGDKKKKPGNQDISDLMHRMVKESLLKFDGSPLFPKRYAFTANYTLSDLEAELYEQVTSYVRTEYNRAENLRKDRRSAVGFALTILQRRLASSPYAILRSLERRRDRLKQQLIDGDIYGDGPNDSYEDPDEEITDLEISNFASAAQNLEELQAEILRLDQLVELARRVTASGKDKKWEELSGLLLDEQLMFSSEDEREKLIIFTEFKDTLDYLKEKITVLMGSDESVVTISGQTPRMQRKQIENQFRSDPQKSILIATDAAGEGINLQNSHLMINYDLPWNPNRLEQRFGRIHRIGQKHTCYLWNLVCSQTREGMVYQRLLEKLDNEKNALQGKVFDILGNAAFQDRSLRSLLMEAVLNESEDEDHLDAALEDELKKAKQIRTIEDQILSPEMLKKEDVYRLRAEMEKKRVTQLQPYFVQSVFLRILKLYHCAVRETSNDKFEVYGLPSFLGSEIPFDSFRFTFVKTEDQKYEFLNAHSKIFQILIGRFLEDYAWITNEGIVLSDPAADEDKIMFVLTVDLKDGTGKLIDKLYILLSYQDGKWSVSDSMPFLDFKLTNEIYVTKPDLVEQAFQTAIKTAVNPRISEFEKIRKQDTAASKKAVVQRLKQEINYWDNEVFTIQVDKEQDPETMQKGIRKAVRRANELQNRLVKRESEFEKLQEITADHLRLITSFKVLAGIADSQEQTADTKLMEEIGMGAVMQIEMELGNIPKDVSKENVGYDIESRCGKGQLRFIEVKARKHGSKTVTVTKNEILASLNQQDRYILAIVDVDENRRTVTYLRRPFVNMPDFSSVSTDFNIRQLSKQAEVGMVKLIEV